MCIRGSISAAAEEENNIKADASNDGQQVNFLYFNKQQLFLYIA